MTSVNKFDCGRFDYCIDKKQTFVYAGPLFTRGMRLELGRLNTKIEKRGSI